MGNAYDYIIVGAGSAGCVLANRLSASSSNSILLIEAGSDMLPGQEAADVVDTYPMSYYNSDYAWPDVFAHNKQHENSPAIPFRQGRLMGGSSSIMGMVALRGTPADYDEWHEMGAQGWAWKDVLPYFRKLETERDILCQDAAGASHGYNGPVPITRLPLDRWPPFAKAVLRWARRTGMSEIEDMNAIFGEGIGASPVSRFDDKRASASICYLDADVRSRSNLTILADATVARLTAKGRRVTGVEVLIGREKRVFSAGETIVSCGALQSPVLLMRSGIGPAENLRYVGVDAICDRPGLGKNLQNHQCLYLVAQLDKSATQPRDLKQHSVASIRYSSGVEGCGPLDMHIGVSSKTGWHELGRRLGALTPIVQKPASRGQIMLTRSEGGVGSRTEFNYLSDERDRVRLIDGVRRAVAIMLSSEIQAVSHRAVPILHTHRMRALNDVSQWNSARSMALAKAIDLMPAVGRPVLASLSEPGLDVGALHRDPQKIGALIDGSVSGLFHPVGSCRMGRVDDPAAVVDEQGRVHGIEGLRVVDASIMPAVPRGNTNIPTIMIAEKVADIMMR